MGSSDFEKALIGVTIPTQELLFCVTESIPLRVGEKRIKINDKKNFTQVKKHTKTPVLLGYVHDTEVNVKFI